MQTFVVVWLVQIFIGLELYSAYQLSTKNEFHLYNETHSSQPKILLVSEGLLGGPESSGELLVRSSSISALPIVGSLTNGLLALSGLTALTKRLPFWSGLANGLIGRGSSPGLMKVPGSFGRNLNQVPGVPGDAPWSLPPQAYGKGIHCPNGLSAPRGVVLMVPGTGFSGSENYAKSPYADKLPGLGFAYCWISLPGYSTVDLQISGELVAYAIKSLAADSGRSISILTYSQGGSNVQWALTFWPSLRPLVASFVAMAPPMRGSAAADVLCMASVVIGGCVPALLQESMLSNYMRAINSGEGAYALVSSTVIYTMMDEIVIPQVPQSASTLEGASNILIQDICGYSHAVDHFTMPSDMGVYGVVIDALVSGRPVNPSTVDRSYCSQLGKTLRYSAVGLASDLKAVYRSLVGNLPQRTRMILKTFTTLRTVAEPLLQPYVCERGFANSCGPPGFSHGENSDFFLNNLSALWSLGSFLGNRKN